SLGGELFIGITDDGSIFGVQNPDQLALVIIDRIKNNILPTTLGLFNVEVKQNGNHSYIRITVAQGLEKPYYLKKYGMSVKGCYTRIGSQSSPMTQNLIMELSSHRVAHTLSNVVSPNQHLTFTQLKIYYAEKGFDASSDYFLRNLGLYTEDDRYNYAAYLMADNNGNSVKVARFRGTEKLDILERNEFGRGCLIKSAYQVLDKLEVVNSTVVRVGGDAARREYRLIDKDAIREAVLNAIIHNDYINGSYPVFEIYDDRIEVISTGGLPVGLTEDEFFKGRSHPRNRELMRIFSDMDLCEQLGSGMKKILKVYSKDIFDISEHFISVRFPYNKEAVKILDEQTNGGVNGGANGGVNGGVNGGANNEEVQLSENAMLVLHIIKQNGSYTQKQIAERSVLSIRSVQRAMKELRDKKIIEREGSDKSGKYITLLP
ncbi:MAG: ATP-binding protein, partial [Sphaerochaetaceae bacterium]